MWVRRCQRCKHFDMREGWDSKVRALAFRVWEIPWKCPECRNPELTIEAAPVEVMGATT